MFYTPGNHKANGLPHDPFKALVAPRPIGWISTVSPEGVHNLAPYSFFQAIASAPPMVMFSSEGQKDTLRNLENSGEFVCSYVGYELRDEMNASSIPAPQDVSEFAHFGIQMADCETVSAKRVANAHAALECRVTEIISPETLDGKGTTSVVVFGQVTGIHINDEVIVDGIFDVRLARPITRLGYMDYDGPEGLFTMRRPEWK